MLKPASVVLTVVMSALTLTPSFAADAARAPAAPASNDLMMNLYNQIQSMQQELQYLRSAVEEQGYRLKKLETESKDRYLDLDRRLSEQSTAGVAVALLPATGDVAAAGQTDIASEEALAPAAVTSETPSSAVVARSPTVAVATAPRPTTTTSVATAGGANEQELYRSALNLLLEENKPQESIAKFQSYLSSFPNGRLLTNALYWQGEAYLLVAGNAEARAVFQRLLDNYPQDPKAPGAMLKLGTAYKQMGDATKAAQVWNELKLRYPESVEEIRKADEYLRAR